MEGIGSYALNYTMAFFFIGGAVLAFIYFWRKGLLSMGEDAKYTMLEDDELGGKDDK